MAEITAALVKALRDDTGQGMMDCKKALEEAGGDIEAAKDILRMKGLASAEKKSARATAEGLIVVARSADAAAAAMVELQCETDFCARNDVFRAMAGNVAAVALAGPDGTVEAGEEITSAVQDAFVKIGENMRYARGIRISAERVGSYVHHNSKVGVLVGIAGDLDNETLANLCMHIAFADPMGIRPDDVPAETVERERRIAVQQTIESGKPPDIAEKIVAGKMRKFIAANALLEQPYVRDDKKKVKEILGPAQVTAFARFAVGQ